MVLFFKLEKRSYLTKYIYDYFLFYHFSIICMQDVSSEITFIFWKSVINISPKYSEAAVPRCSSRSVFLLPPALESLFNRAADLQACNLIKKRLKHRCFPVNTAKFLRTAFFIGHLWWLAASEYYPGKIKLNIHFYFQKRRY